MNVLRWVVCCFIFAHTHFLPLPQVAAGYVLHVGEVGRGAMRVGDEVTAAVNLKRRADIVPNHTFTHVLNFALREARRL